MFDNYLPNPQGRAAIKEFKTHMADAVRKALDMLPEGREKSLFVTKIEEAIFFGTKAIAAHEDNHEDVQVF